MTDKQDRLNAVNRLLITIAFCGRRFFWCPEHGRIAKFKIADNGRVWFVDHYTGKSIYTHYAGRWKHFSHGGTMQDLVCNFRDHITKGKSLPASALGPWPEWFCDGDLWGYGDDMQVVRKRAEDLGIVTRKRDAA